MNNQQFKTGDKVRFRQDGEIGDYNKRVYGSDMFVEYSVIITEPDSEIGVNGQEIVK